MGAQVEQTSHPEGARWLEDQRRKDFGDFSTEIDGEKPMGDEITRTLHMAIEKEYGKYTADDFRDSNMAQEVQKQMMTNAPQFKELTDDFDDVENVYFNQQTLKLTYTESDKDDVIAEFNLEPVLKPYLERVIEDKIRQARALAEEHSFNRRKTLSPGLSLLSSGPKKRPGSNKPEAPKPPEDTSKTEGTKKPEGSNTSTDKKTEPTVTESFTAERLKYYEVERQKRERVLAAINCEKVDEAITLSANLDKAFVQNAVNEDANVFDDEWGRFNNTSEIETLLGVHDEENKVIPETGYLVNPFKVAGFDLDSLRKVIRDEASDDNILSHNELAEPIYTEKYQHFLAAVKKSGVSEDCIDLLEDDVGDVDSPLDEDDLLSSYQKVSRISSQLSRAGTSGEIKEPDLRKLYAYKDEIKKVEQVLGDYCASITKLINYLQNVEQNAGDELEDEKTMMNDSSEVAVALQELFLVNNDRHRLQVEEEGIIVDDVRDARFRDLNGNTVFVDSNWFNQRQSETTAYKLAYEAAQPPLSQLKPDEKEKLDPESARIYLNNLLQLGAATTSELHPNKQTVATIINDLEKAGVTVPPDNKVIHYQQDAVLDQQTLYAALELKNINELTEDRAGDEAAAAKYKARHLLMRVGSVVNQKQEELSRRETILQNKVRVVKLKPDEIEWHMKQLQNTGRFSPEELKNVENRMLMGIMLVGNTDPENWYNAINGVGLSAGFPIDLGHDVTLTVGGNMHAGTGYGLSAGIGKKIDAGDGWSITLTIAPQVNFGDGATKVGTSESIRVTKQLESCDMYMEAYASQGWSVDKGHLFPGFGAAVGVDLMRASIKENYEKNINTVYSAEGLSKLNNMTAEARFDEVSAHPQRYPALGDMALRLKGTRPALDRKVQIGAFNLTYTEFKKTKDTKSLSDAIDDVMFAGVKAGVDSTIIPPPFAPAPVVVPTPYAGLEFPISKKKYTFISATPEQAVANLNADDIQAQIKKNLELQGKNVIEVSSPIYDLKSSGTLVYMPGSGRDGKGEYVLSNVTPITFSKFVTKKPDQIAKITQELAEHAGLKVKEIKPGQLVLEPYKAHGLVEVYPDPDLPKDVFITSNGGDLILSAPNNLDLTITRSDVTYPTLNHGVVEKTVIVITHRRQFDMQAVTNLAERKLTKYPGRSWVANTVNGALGDRNTNKGSIIDYGEFTKLEGSLKDRMQSGPLDDSEYQDRRTAAHKGLMHEMTRGQSDAPNYKIDSRVVGFVEKLKAEYAKEQTKKDGGDKTAIAALTEIKSYITEKVDVGGNYKAVNSQEKVDLLEKAIRERVSAVTGYKAVLNPQEFAYIVREITDTTFVQASEVPVKKRNEWYKNKFKTYDMPMFIKSLNSDPRLQFSMADTIAVQDLLLQNLAKIDFNARPGKIENGTFVMQDVGNRTLKIKGEARYLYQNVPGARAEGVLGRLDLKPGEPGIRGKLAQYLILKNSPFNPNTIYNGTVDEKTDVPLENRREMETALRTPFAQRALTVLGAMLSDVEMLQIKDFLHDSAKYPLHIKDHDNQHNVDVARMDTLKKVLTYLGKIRAGELAGTEKIQLEKDWEITTIPVTYIGAYTVCTNYVKALEDEVFALHGKTTNIVHVSQWVGAQSEGSILTEVQNRFSTWSIIIGASLPIPIKRDHDEPEVTTDKKKDKPDDGKIGEGGDKPSTETEPKVAAKPAAGVGGDVGGREAETSQANEHTTGDIGGGSRIRPNEDPSGPRIVSTTPTPQVELRSDASIKPSDFIL